MKIKTIYLFNTNPHRLNIMVQMYKLPNNYKIISEENHTKEYGDIPTIYYFYKLIIGVNDEN